MDHKILLFPDGTAVGRPNSFGQPTRSPRPQFARIFPTESKRQNYRHQFAQFNFKNATLRIEIIEETE